MAVVAAVPPSRDMEYWLPEPLFRGETVFCLASGPSLTQEICDKVRSRRTIVINSSCSLAPWADILFFTDSGWFHLHRSIVEEWPGLVVTMSAAAKRELPGKVRRVRGWGDPTLPKGAFPVPGAPHIRQGRSSGHTAIGLAVALGASRVAMLGYDMRVVGGREHHHGDYLRQPRNLAIYADSFVPAFAGWNETARAVGVEILNCTPGSAISEFAFADLDEVLSCCRN